MAKLVYKNKEYGQEVSIKVSPEADIQEMGEALYGLLVGMTYAPETIAKILDIEMTEETREGGRLCVPVGKVPNA